MSGNTSVSPKFKIDGEKFSTQSTGTVPRFDLGVVNPPVVNVSSGQATNAIAKWICPYPDIAFEKISLPEWDGISKFTAKISNEPDYIKDYHFISLMRCIDYYIKPDYNAIINVNLNTPTFGKLNRS